MKFSPQMNEHRSKAAHTPSDYTLLTSDIHSKLKSETYENNITNFYYIENKDDCFESSKYICDRKRIDLRGYISYLTRVEDRLMSNTTRFKYEIMIIWVRNFRGQICFCRY